MNTQNFPSGPWIGFYTYNRARQKRHRMDLGLTFATGRITGSGSDDLGKFVVSGRYNPQNGQCHWAKRYVGAHDVYYKGYREGRGIWGTWELTFTTGGFHIWPLGSGAGDGEVETKGQEQPVTVEEPAQVALVVGSLRVSHAARQARALAAIREMQKLYHAHHVPLDDPRMLELKRVAVLLFR
jgi:hypothetical protein